MHIDQLDQSSQHWVIVWKGAGFPRFKSRKERSVRFTSHIIHCSKFLVRSILFLRVKPIFLNHKLAGNNLSITRWKHKNDEARNILLCPYWKYVQKLSSNNYYHSWQRQHNPLCLMKKLPFWSSLFFQILSYSNPLPSFYCLVSLSNCVIVPHLIC